MLSHPLHDQPADPGAQAGAAGGGNDDKGHLPAAVGRGSACTAEASYPIFLFRGRCVTTPTRCALDVKGVSDGPMGNQRFDWLAEPPYDISTCLAVSSELLVKYGGPGRNRKSA